MDIEKQIKLPECVQGNMFIMAGPECLEKRGVGGFPRLWATCQRHLSDGFMRDINGLQAFSSYLEARKEGMMAEVPRAQVTDWGSDEYLYINIDACVLT